MNRLEPTHVIPTIMFTDIMVPSQAALMTAVRKRDTEVAWILAMESEYFSSQATIKPLHARCATRSQVSGVKPVIFVIIFSKYIFVIEYRLFSSRSFPSRTRCKSERTVSQRSWNSFSSLG